MINNIKLLFLWIGRIFAVVNISIFIMFAIGEGFPNFLSLTISEKYVFVSYYILLLSTIFSFKYLLTSSLLIIFSYLFMGYTNYLYSSTNSFWTGYIFFLFPISALFNLAAWYLKKKEILDDNIQKVK